MSNQNQQTGGRESFKSRLGFILISAGCAIGIGNVWRFPYVVGENGGGLFVLLYILCLVVVGVPVLTMEYAIGRASKKSITCAYQELEKPKQKWHLHGYVSLVGNYLLMMFYTTVSGWMMYYFYRYAVGEMDGLDKTAVEGAFNGMLSEPGTMALWMGIVVVLGFAACSLGVQKGLERITKWMMIALLVLIIGLAVYSILLPGALEGLKFYLLPNAETIQKNGFFNVLVAALNQSFFTLSLGIGSMMIFGSYMKRDNTLLKESVTVAGLDTFVAITSGLIIFPACFAFGVQPDSGPGLVFITLPNVFSDMAAGRILGTLFFLFMTFASLSTVMAVFENILSCCMDKWGWSRAKACIVNFVGVLVLSMPCVLGFNLWSDFQPLGPGSAVLDLEDFFVSNIMLPLGSLIILLFCTHKFGWGFNNYMAEANAGKGIKVPKILKVYFKWVLPVILIIMFVHGIIGVIQKL
ncbi:MAG: sodium-dependent transporter [Lachnospiraceae bacterium]|nr:sodium-dependent transporter [Lachnospiraceae bacterium]